MVAREDLSANASLRSHAVADSSYAGDSPQSHSARADMNLLFKERLSVALLKAEHAVNLDAAKRYSEALEAYEATVHLLGKVVDMSESTYQRTVKKEIDARHAIDAIVEFIDEEPNSSEAQSLERKLPGYRTSYDRCKKRRSERKADWKRLADINHGYEERIAALRASLDATSHPEQSVSPAQMRAQENYARPPPVSLRHKRSASGQRTLLEEPLTPSKTSSPSAAPSRPPGGNPVNASRVPKLPEKAPEKYPGILSDTGGLSERPSLPATPQRVPASTNRAVTTPTSLPYFTARQPPDRSYAPSSSEALQNKTQSPVRGRYFSSAQPPNLMSSSSSALKEASSSQTPYDDSPMRREAPTSLLPPAEPDSDTSFGFGSLSMNDGPLSRQAVADARQRHYEFADYSFSSSPSHENPYMKPPREISDVDGPLSIRETSKETPTRAVLKESPSMQTFSRETLSRETFSRETINKDLPPDGETPRNIPIREYAPADLSAFPPVRRPFVAMTRLAESFSTPSYLTSHLCISPDTWTQQGVKLTNLEVKTRMLATLADGLAFTNNPDANVHDEIIAFTSVAEKSGTLLDRKLGQGWTGASSIVSRTFDRRRPINPLYTEILQHFVHRAMAFDQYFIDILDRSGHFHGLPDSSAVQLSGAVSLVSSFFLDILSRLILPDVHALLEKRVASFASSLK